MAKTIGIKPEEEYARSYVDQLILGKLTEMESAVKLGELADKLSGQGIGLATVRSLLASNPERFAYHERKWVPASRIQGQGRPFAEAMAIIIYRYGGPMPLSLLISEISRIRHVTPEEAEPLVRRVVSGDKAFVLTPRDEVSLIAWSFQAYDEKAERAFAINGVTADQVAAVKAKLGEDFDYLADDAVRVAIEKTAPIQLKVLGGAFFTGLNSPDPRSVVMFDPHEFNMAVLSVPGYVFGPDGVIHPESDVKGWISTAIRLADRLAPTVELDDAAPMEVKPEDIDRIIAKVLGNEGSTTATKILEESFEITASNKTFPDDLANVMTALKGNPKVQWVGGDRFRKAGDVPEYIHEVPEPFHFVQIEAVDEEGELLDVELTDEGLSSTLRKLLSHPLATDVLDEDPQPAPKQMPETVRLVLKSIHRELGTFPLCQLPTNWLDA